MQNATFHQGLHCLLRQNRSSEKEIQWGFFKIPSVYTMDYPDLTVSNFMEKSTYKGLIYFFKISFNLGQGKLLLRWEKTRIDKKIYSIIIS